MITLDIFSDPVCPWCFIGKTNLFRALEERPDHPFDIRWQPFQLNLGMPRDGMERAAYLEAKFRGQRGAAEAYKPVLEAAEAAGLKMDLAGIEIQPNTLDAQRLIHWAGIEGRQTAVAHALFAAFFQQCRDIGDHEVLADIADGAGMDAALIRRLLASDADVEAIHARDKAAREMGVTSVPTFVIGGQSAVPGAQPPELWCQVIDELAAQGA